MDMDDFEVWLKIFGMIFILGIVVLLVVVFGCFYTVHAGQRGILLTWGNPDMQAKTEGLHFKIPIAQSVVLMDIRTQKYEAKAGAASKDLQTVATEVTINYKISDTSVVDIYKNIGVDYQDKIIQPAVQEVVKAATAQYTAEELITKRPEVKDIIDQELKEKLMTNNIIVQDILITNFDFSASFNQAIESKVTAEQNALAAKNKLEQVKYEAEQKIIEAQGKANATMIEGSSIRVFPEVIQLRAIEKWNGILPTVTSSTVPFIDVSSFKGE